MTFPLNSDFPFQFSLLLLFLCVLYIHGELEVDTGCLHPIYQGKVSPWTQTLTVSQLVFLTPMVSSLPLDLWDYRQPPVLHRCWRSKPWSSQLHGKPCPQTHLSGAILFWYRVGLYYVAELRLASDMQYCWSCWVKGMHQHAWPWTSHSIHVVIRGTTCRSLFSPIIWLPESKPRPSARWHWLDLLSHLFLGDRALCSPGWPWTLYNWG